MDIKKKKGEIPEQPKNIVTATPKKGGFGVNKTTLRCADHAAWHVMRHSTAVCNAPHRDW